MASPVAPNDASDSAFIVQHLYTAVLWVNDDLTITWLNAQAEQLLAISRERLLGQSILTLLAPEELEKDERDSIDNLSNKPLHNHLKPYAVEQKRPICSLSERFNQAQKYQQPFIDHDHKITLQAGDIAVTIDYSVTPVVYQQQAHYIIEMWGKDRQSRISEEQRQQQQYDVARHMLRSVAHEVKNPLAGIRGAAQLLQRQFVKFSEKNINKNLQKTTDKLRSYTDIIISETDRLTQLIGQLLGSNQLPNWQAVNIHEPLEHVLTLVMNNYSQVTLKRDYDLSLPELDADKDQLIQVFLNLINNACEAMTEQYAANNFDTAHAKANDTQTDKGYKPQLHIQTRVAFQHTIGSQQHKQVLQVAITDNGSGIDDALIGQIFFPMVTSRASGTGLGLSIVQDIISRHHGMIDVSSIVTKNHEPHKQTRFTLYLPFNQPALDA
ncbi:MULTISPECIES: two-component system sensor histidine kinase NtrB [unclassified Psychrobacter]|uniref:two-component system sensor histidine kinase NtrB n=1 Tax=unclassified Psychrobacter TaxID=196806 RepID=UPI00071E77DF|nr:MULTISPECIES: ATP-binding protein [unclassified Psychrobacter]OLF39402.1 two-component sensor histidine kinase [Psychrobacter sp. Cmf 22.2]